MIRSSKEILRTTVLLLLCSVTLGLRAQGLPRTFTREDGLCDHLEYSDNDWKNHYFYTSPVITIGHAADKLRFTVTETTSGDAGGGYPCFALAEFYLYDAKMNPIALTVANFSTNAQEESEGPMEFICDNNYATYFHSLWSQYDESTGEHYIEVSLPKSLDAFAFGYVSRYENVAPASITVSDPYWVEPDPVDPSDYDDLTLQAEETSEGEEWLITLALDTEVDYTAFQMDLSLPKEVTDNTMMQLFLAEGRGSDTHVITSSMQRGNKLRVVSYASDDAPFASCEGDLFYLLMTAKGEVPAGEYPIIVSNIRFSTVKGVEKKKDNLTAILTVTGDTGIQPNETDATPTPLWNLNGTRATERHGLLIGNGMKRYIK